MTYQLFSGKSFFSQCLEVLGTKCSPSPQLTALDQHILTPTCCALQWNREGQGLWERPLHKASSVWVSGCSTHLCVHLCVQDRLCEQPTVQHSEHLEVQLSEVRAIALQLCQRISCLSISSSLKRKWQESGLCRGNFQNSDRRQNGCQKAELNHWLWLTLEWTTPLSKLLFMLLWHLPCSVFLPSPQGYTPTLSSSESSVSGWFPSELSSAWERSAEPALPPSAFFFLP